MGDIIWYLSFSFWLTLHSIIICRIIHVAANCIIFPFMWLTLHCIYERHLYPFTCRWTSRWLPCLGYCKIVLLWKIGAHVYFQIKLLFCCDLNSFAITPEIKLRKNWAKCNKFRLEVKLERRSLGEALHRNTLIERTVWKNPQPAVLNYIRSN